MGRLVLTKSELESLLGVEQIKFAPSVMPKIAPKEDIDPSPASCIVVDVLLIALSFHNHLFLLIFAR
ncbi:hypothetical protein ACFPTO_01505 [Paraburkholderia denitrificans]|uniref:Uncharacterized protein n=1 Tax=Paraburkholderia denitrificans TaxID=694025 RepID=A0ABW0J3A1_9BURK